MQPGWMGGGGPGHGTSLLIGLVIAVAILIARNRKPRPLKIERLWIRPAIFLMLTALSLSASPPPLDAISLVLMAVATLAGVGLGWQRGRFIHIDVHQETHELTTRVSPVGLLFLIAIVVARLGLRAETNAVGRMHISLTAFSDAIVLLLGAMMVAQGSEIWLRARRVLAEARTNASPKQIVHAPEA